MTETSPVEELKRYIYDEMPEAERADLDARFFEDDELFQNYLELENDLTDRFAQNILRGDDQQRFERSLAVNPARREKLKTARVLQTLAAEERVKTPAIAAAPTFWEQIKEFFTLKASAVQFTGAALVIAVIGIGGFLIYQNQKANDYAEIERRRETERIEKENLLRELEEQQRRVEEENRRREQENQILQKPDTNVNQPVDNTALEAVNANAAEEKERKEAIQKLKKELENSERKTLPPSRNKPAPPSPIITTVLKLSVIGERGGTDDKIIALTKDNTEITATLELPEGMNDAKLSVNLNGATLKKSVKTRKQKDGRRVLTITIPARKLKDDLNVLTVGGYESKFYIERK